MAQNRAIRRGEAAVYDEYFKSEMLPSRRPPKPQPNLKKLGSDERLRASQLATLVGMPAWQELLDTAADFCKEIGLFEVEPGEGDRELLAAKEATWGVLEFLRRVHSLVDEHHKLSVVEEDRDARRRQEADGT